MDNNTLLIILVAIFAIIILAWMVRYRRKGGATIKAGGIEMSVTGENDPAPDKIALPGQAAAAAAPATPVQPQGGARIADSEAGTNLSARDETGAGASVERSKAHAGSITATSKNPPAPKA